MKDNLANRDPNQILSEREQRIYSGQLDCYYSGVVAGIQLPLVVMQAKDQTYLTAYLDEMRRLQPSYTNSSIIPNLAMEQEVPPLTLSSRGNITMTEIHTTESIIIEQLTVAFGIHLSRKEKGYPFLEQLALISNRLLIRGHSKTRSTQSFGEMMERQYFNYGRHTSSLFLVTTYNENSI